MNTTFLTSAWSNPGHRTHESDSIPRMAIDPAGHAIHLAKWQHVAMRDAVGWTVKPLAGTVWITLDQDSRDIVLEAGQSFVVDRPGKTLISAMDDARVCVSRGLSRCVAASSASEQRPGTF
jgi:hypothetical protein